MLLNFLVTVVTWRRHVVRLHGHCLSC